MNLGDYRLLRSGLLECAFKFGLQVEVEKEARLRALTIVKIVIRQSSDLSSITDRCETGDNCMMRQVVLIMDDWSRCWYR